MLIFKLDINRRELNAAVGLPKDYTKMGHVENIAHYVSIVRVNDQFLSASSVLLVQVWEILLCISK